jgi:hypothetical protein
VARKQPPKLAGHAASSPHPKGLLELDRFSKADVDTWNARSKDLDELHDLLFFGVEPQRLRLREQLLEALQSMPAPSFSLEKWFRIVTYRYSLSPLSAAGSLNGVGGRFNVGIDVDKSNTPFPALYLAGDFETAYREKWQIPSGQKINGLAPEELALVDQRSTSTVLINGHVERVFNIGGPLNLAPFCKVLREMAMPNRVHTLMRRLKTPDKSVYMVKTPKQLLHELRMQNWRAWPVQFGLPSPSQIFGQLIREAGFEGILYPSTKGGGACRPGTGFCRKFKA